MSWTVRTLKQQMTSCWSTCSVFQTRRCHSWSTRCWAAGQRSWRSSLFSVFHTPGRAGPEPWASSWHRACTSCQIPHRSVSPAPHQSPFLPTLGHTLWQGPEGRGKEDVRELKDGHKHWIFSTLIIAAHLDFALIEGTHWCLVSRMAQIHKHHIPGLLLGSREILFVDPVRQCNWMENC